MKDASEPNPRRQPPLRATYTWTAPPPMHRLKLFDQQKQGLGPMPSGTVAAVQRSKPNPSTGEIHRVFRGQADQRLGVWKQRRLQTPHGRGRGWPLCGPKHVLRGRRALKVVTWAVGRPSERRPAVLLRRFRPGPAVDPAAGFRSHRRSHSQGNNRDRPRGSAVRLPDGRFRCRPDRWSRSPRRPGLPPGVGSASWDPRA